MACLSTSPLNTLFRLLSGRWSTRELPVLKITSNLITTTEAIIVVICWSCIRQYLRTAKVRHLYLCVTHSLVSSSLLHILQQFEQLAAHPTSTVAKYAVQTIKPTMIEQILLTLQSSDCTYSTIPDSSTDSTFCSAEVLHETISSLLDHFLDQLELNCSLLKQNLQLRSQFHGMKGNLSICHRDSQFTSWRRQ